MRQPRLYNNEKLFILDCFRGELHHCSEAYQDTECFEILKALRFGFEEGK